VGAVFYFGHGENYVAGPLSFRSVECDEGDLSRNVEAEVGKQVCKWV